MNNVVVNPVTPPQFGGDNAIWIEDFSECSGTDDDVAAAALANMFSDVLITGCADGIPYLLSAGYPCETDLSVLGMSGTISDICACTCSGSSTITTNDVSEYGDWKWSDQSPGGQWTTNTTVIASETPENGFMMMEADFYNTGPQNGIAEDGTVGENAISAYFTIGPIDLSASETDELVLQFYSDYRICC